MYLRQKFVFVTFFFVGNDNCDENNHKKDKFEWKLLSRQHASAIFYIHKVNLESLFGVDTH